MIAYPCPMLKYVNYDIVFQEFPDEVTLAINLSCCPNGCIGCHSAYLRGDVGEELTWERLLALTESYAGNITCVSLMGGDNDPASVLELLARLKKHYAGKLKTGWYSGRTWEPSAESLRESLDYLKLGPYLAALGPLNSRDTNQRFYHINPKGELEDETFRFWK